MVTELRKHELCDVHHIARAVSGTAVCERERRMCRTMRADARGVRVHESCTLWSLQAGLFTRRSARSGRLRATEVVSPRARVRAYARRATFAP